MAKAFTLTLARPRSATTAQPLRTALPDQGKSSTKRSDLARPLHATPNLELLLRKRSTNLGRFWKELGAF